MTLDEAIAHAEEVAKEQDKLSKRYDDASGYSRSHNDDIRTSEAKMCERCAEDHRQLAGWLRDYKRLKEQEPCEDAVSREDALLCLTGEIKETDTAESLISRFVKRIRKLPSVNPQEPRTGHCKGCKYFEYDSVAKVDGIPLIVAHEICSRWGDGCKTKEDGYCFLFEPQESKV